jgi:hypothetical protein
MDAVRVSGRFRLNPFVEWILAVAFVAAGLTVASIFVRGLEESAAAEHRAPEPSAPSTVSVPASVPERAVSVQVLPLADGKEVRVGETASAVATRLGRAAESGRQEVDGSPHGERLTRFYEYAGSQFILVFEPRERQGEPYVAGIYLLSLIPKT